MGSKKKWIDKAQENLQECSRELSALFTPLLDSNGIVDLNEIENQSGMAYSMALLLGKLLLLENDKDLRRFGADDVVPLKIEISENQRLAYWGQIYWLALPEDHRCHRSYQDPFYALFEVTDDQLEIKELSFGDLDRTDLDSDQWVEQKMNWMYEMYT
ncbi:hypothetical protein [Sanyastnella coralliicola]|uniref:hypothetical protein n=1 Tax=Sanyastnella coralliicola TaxID=3069118 RepID=UPI0027BA9F77|nr:hypothetical protein [Longitalea sp. SCSIO 12813]